MSDITLTPVTISYNTSNINTNFDIIQDSINNDILHVQGGNNIMSQALDMNGQDILNLGVLDVEGLKINGIPVTISNLGSLGPNTVGNTQLVDGSVTENKLAAGITAAKFNFLQNGTGAVTRTVQDRLTDVLSARDFGVVGDGVADDRASLYNALVAAHLQNKKLYLPKGTYLLGSNIRLPDGYAPSIVGESRTGTIIKAAPSIVLGTNDLIDWVLASGWSIENLTVDFNNIATSASCAALGSIGCINFAIRGCNIININKMGVGINGGHRFYIEENYISRPTGAGTYNQAILVSSSYQQSTDGFIRHNICENSGTDFSVTRCIVQGNVISNFQFGAGVTTEQDTNNSNYYTIIDNFIFGSTGTDVNSYNPGGIENWGAYSHISNNTIFSCSGSGIDQGGIFSTISNNTIFNNGGVGGSGIVSRYGTGFQGSFCTIVGNKVFDTRAGASKTQVYGYADENPNVSRNIISGNHFQDNKTAAMSILGSGHSLDTPSVSYNTTLNPGTIANGASPAWAFSISGAMVGDFVVASYAGDLQGITVTAYVRGSNDVVVVFSNTSGASRTLGNAALRFKVIKPYDWAAY
jgi:hypothetical protein